jgi:hypothetical protein
MIIAQTAETPSCGVQCLMLLDGMRRISSGRGEASLLSESIADATRPLSMWELITMGKSLGIELVGVDLQNGRGLDRPTICYLKQGQHGHFVVIRPVGRSGTLVQVLDPNLAPYVMERSELVKLPGWTGLALVPERLVGWWRVAGVALLVGGVGLMVVARLRSKGYLACIVRRSPDTARAGEVGP